jgi:hypothetical protein
LHPDWIQGLQTQQIIDIVKIYLRDNPDKRHARADSLITRALKEKFPCD